MLTQQTPTTATEEVTYECTNCDGGGETNTLAKCRCCSRNDPPDVRCYVKCPECKGLGSVDVVIAAGLVDDERADAIANAVIDLEPKRRCDSCEKLVPKSLMVSMRDTYAGDTDQCFTCVIAAEKRAQS